MKLTAKQFTKAKGLYEEILKIDKEIIEIEKIANEVVTDNCLLSFGIKIENLNKTKEEKKNIFGEDQSIRPEFYMPSMISIMMGMNQGESKKKQTDEYKFEFSDSDCLKVMEVILRVKYEERINLVKQIENLGVTL